MREERVLRKLKSGDPAGLEELMDAYLPYVSSVVWHILRGSMQAEDMEEIASDVFLAAWNQAADLVPGKAKAWLGSVARHKAKNKLRQLGRTIPLDEDDEDLASSVDFALDVERDEEGELVRGAIASLSPSDREIFLRHYYYAQTVEEISTAIEMNPATVKTRLRRGREKLKDRLMRGGFSYEA